MASTDETETQISTWRSYLTRRDAMTTTDADELEGHLRDQMDSLEASGLSADEAFLVAVKRMGALDAVSREFAREHSERLWKQLVVGEPVAARRVPGGLILAISLAVAAAVTIKLPALLGLDQTGAFTVRNAPVLVLMYLAAFFLVRRRAGTGTIVAVAVPFVAAAVILNAYPFASDGMTLPLAVIHSLVALWIVTGIAYVNGLWRSATARMDFVRFTGEWVVYLALIALGGGVLAALTIGVFGAIGLDAQSFVENWLIPCGATGAVVIAAWLVEAKQSVIENIAPVLTKVFTPLFTLLLLVLIVAGFVQRGLAAGSDTEMFGSSDLMVIFDIVLIVVLGLLLYSLSARDRDAAPSWFDGLQLVMVLLALVIDVIVLVAMISRIGEFGASANKLASLGLNLILLANLAGAAWLHFRFLRRRTRYATLERWQTSYIPVYLVWAAVVVVVFPPVFGFA